MSGPQSGIRLLDKPPTQPKQPRGRLTKRTIPGSSAYGSSATLTPQSVAETSVQPPERQFGWPGKQSQPVGNLPSSTDSASNLPTPQFTPTIRSREPPKTIQTHLPTYTSFNRKREVYVDIPPSPLHTTTPVSSPRISGSTFGRQLKPVVELPLLPSAQGRLNIERNGMKAPPLSAKAFNLNTSHSTEPPLKKAKVMAEQGESSTEKLRCHQCAKHCLHSELAFCKQTLPTGRYCRVRYCGTCLLKRYHEAFPEANSPDFQCWKCPKCRGMCNCSKCMRARGLDPLPLNTFKQQPVPSMVLHKFPVVELTPKYSQAPQAVAGPSNAQITDVRRKKPVPEPNWTAVPTALSRFEVEDRIYLREFVLRFSDLMPKITAANYETLDEFEILSQSTAAIIVQELVDLIALESDDEKEKKVLRNIHDKLIPAGSLPAAIWACLKELRSSLHKDAAAELLSLPDPSSVPAYLKDKKEEIAEVPAAPRTRRTARRNQLELDNGVKHAVQLLPPILALCEYVLQVRSIRAELEEGSEDTKGENKAYYAEIKKENERWVIERAKMGVEASEDGASPSSSSSDSNKEKEKEQAKGKLSQPKVKDVGMYKAALAAHKTNLASIENIHLLELQGTAQRFKPLGRDSRGRVYYACSARRSKDNRRKVKAPEESVRKGLGKWGWFLAVWGPGGSHMLEEDENGIRVNANGEKWWGFSEPEEIRKLAKWLAYVEELDEKNPVKMNGGQNLASPLKRKRREENIDEMNEGPPTVKQMKALVKGLNEYADLLAWRISA